MINRFRPSPEQCLSLTSFDGTDVLTLAHNAVFALVYGSGIVRSELAAARWRDVMQVGRRGEMKVKGPRSRTVPLPAMVIKRLAGYRRALGLTKESDRICPPLLLATLARTLRARARILGLPGTVTVVGLRKAYVRHLVEAGAPIQAVSQLLGIKHHDSTLRLTLS